MGHMDSRDIAAEWARAHRESSGVFATPAWKVLAPGEEAEPEDGWVVIPVMAGTPGMVARLLGDNPLDD